jgi:hypothetical protein
MNTGDAVAAASDPAVGVAMAVGAAWGLLVVIVAGTAGVAAPTKDREATGGALAGDAHALMSSITSVRTSSNRRLWIDKPCTT